MSDQDFRQIFDEFLGKLGQHALSNEQRYLILRVVGKRLGAVLAAAPAAALDEASMQKKIDELYESSAEQSGANSNSTTEAESMSLHHVISVSCGFIVLYNVCLHSKNRCGAIPITVRWFRHGRPIYL